MAVRSEDWQARRSTYTATARATPRVLQSIHTYQTSLNPLLEDHQNALLNPAAVPGAAAIHQSRKILQTQLLTDVADEVVTLKIGAAWLARDLQDAEVVVEAEALLPRMRQLQSLHLQGPLHSAILRELPALCHLTCLQLGSTCSTQVIKELCSTLALSCLDLEGIDEGGAAGTSDYQEILAIVASCKTSSLRELVLPLPAAEMQHLSVLSALTALTALSVRTGSHIHDLGGLARVTGLKSLRLEGCGSKILDTVVQPLSPLTALTGLTLLDLSEVPQGAVGERDAPRGFAAISALTALQVLRCSLYDKGRGC